MTKRKVGEVAVVLTLLLAAICTLVSVIMSYAGTSNQSKQAIVVANEANTRSIANAGEISGIRAEVKATHEDVLIIKEHLINR